MKLIKVILYTVSPFVFIFILPTFVLLLFKKPSHDRKWEFGQEKLVNFAFDTVNKNKVKIKNFRDFDWNSRNDVKKWTEKEFDINNIIGIDIVIAHFNGIGHIFLIFNLLDGTGIGMSIEARRDGGEKFTILGGLKFDYELIYIFASKKDLISLRRKRKEKLCLYQTKINAKKSQILFKLFAQKANKIYKKPEFYHIFFRNCGNLISDELKKISGKKFLFFGIMFFLPNITGKILFDMDIVKTDKSNFKEV